MFTVHKPPLSGCTVWRVIVVGLCVFVSLSGSKILSSLIAGMNITSCYPTCSKNTEKRRQRNGLRLFSTPWVCIALATSGERVGTLLD